LTEWASKRRALNQFGATSHLPAPVASRGAASGSAYLAWPAL